jgi:hypothetical protein
MKVNMFKLIVTAVAGLSLLAAVTSVRADSTANQTVTYEVDAISSITVSGNPGALIITAAPSGSAPTSVQDATTSYAYTSNQTRKITAQIDTAMPSGLTLTVALAAPTGGTSAGDVTLGTSASDVVTGIPAVNESGKTITYKLSATAAAGVVASASKTVTLTVAAP